MTLAVAWSALALATLWAIARALDRRRRTRRLMTLRAEWGRLRDRPRDLVAIAAYHRFRAASDPDRALDDRTWADLNLNEVFSVFDRTESVVGQQVLYARLRATPQGDHLTAFEALVTQMSEDAPAREHAQLALGQLRAPAGYDLWWLAQPGSLDSAPWHALFPVMTVSMAVVVALVLLWPPAVFVVVVGAIASLVARASIAHRLRVVAGAFRQVSPLVTVAELLKTLDGDATSPLLTALRVDAPRLSRLRQIAGWAGRDPTAAAGGDLAATLFEYLNLVFWLDATALFFGARELSARAPELLRLIAAVGEVDAAVSVASYRAGAPGWTRPTFRSSGPAALADLRHPLLPGAIPNSIVLAPPHGVILTGSNMSGKSTFLRTVGVNAVLAQTIHTSVASRYDAPVFAVRACIGRADDPATGKSYYLAEVEAVVALVRAAQGDGAHLMLFDELFRGTNAVERIAAGEAVLRTLLAPRPDGPPSPHVIIVATHDQELVDLLDGRYAAFHFTDTIDAAGLSFDYTLAPGAATTRNAIALLEQRGAPGVLVSQALARARALDRARTASASIDREPR
jgi:MutS domain V